MKTRLVLSLIFFAALLAACAAPATPAPVPTAMPNPTAVPQVVVPTDTTQPTEMPAPTTPPQPTNTTASAAGGAEVKVAISGFKFNPVEISIHVGDTVTWTNNDSATHNVQADDGSWKSPNLAQGQSFSHTFTTAGTVPYNCGFHASMKATVIVK